MLKLIYEQSAAISLVCSDDYCEWVFDEIPEQFDDWWTFHAQEHANETGHVVAIVSEVYVQPESKHEPN